MKIGMIGLGRMGANMVRRLLNGGHECVVFDRCPQRSRNSRRPAPPAPRHSRNSSRTCPSRARSGSWCPPRSWIARSTICSPFSIPTTSSSTAATPITSTTSAAQELRAKQIHYVDVGTSGGVWGIAARLLPHDRRRTRGRRTSRSDLRIPRPRRRRYPAHTRPRESPQHRHPRLSPLRPKRRRTFREDGSQRNRVRPDGRLRRRSRHSARRRRRQTRPRHRRRNHSAARAGALSIRSESRPTSPSSGDAAA